MHLPNVDAECRRHVNTDPGMAGGRVLLHLRGVLIMWTTRRGQEADPGPDWPFRHVRGTAALGPFAIRRR